MIDSTGCMLAGSGYHCKPQPADIFGHSLGVKTPYLSALFRTNLARLMQSDRTLKTQEALAERARVGQRTVSRILRGEQSPTLKVVEKLAGAFDLEPWQMLVPDLEPGNPPITKQVDDQQRQLWARFRQAAQDLASYELERSR